MEPRLQLQKEALDQLAELLADYEQLRGRSQYDDVSDLPDEARVLGARFQAALDRLTFPGSSYARAADAVRGEAFHAKLRELRAIGDALRADVERGWVQDLTELVHASTFSDLLDVAAELQSKGYKDAAAVVAGTALEVHLRALSSKAGIEPKGPNGKSKAAATLNSDLRKAGIFGPLQEKQVTAWLAVRNSAAHGHYGDYSADHVERLIEDVTRLIADYPA